MDGVQGGVVETIPPSVGLPVWGTAVRLCQPSAPLRNGADEKPAGLEEPPTYFGVWVCS